MRIRPSPEQAAEWAAALCAALAAHHRGEPWELEVELPDEVCEDGGPSMSDRVEMLPGDRFKFHGRTYPLSGDQWIVLDEIVNGQGEFSAIAERLWGDPMAEKAKIYFPVRALRNALKRLGLPLVARTKSERAYLDVKN